MKVSRVLRGIHRETGTRLVKIKLLILDVDGVLTSGDLPYGADGNIEKTFYVQDGSAIKRWQKCGGGVAILSGRTAPSVDARAKDLGIEIVIQNSPDKASGFEKILAINHVDRDAIAAIGDDIPDLPVFARCGVSIAVANAHRLVKRRANYVTRHSGGRGAIAEAIGYLMRLNGWIDG